MQTSSKSSPELICCRGCLATDVNLFDIHKNQLAEAFAYITGYPVSSQDGLPQLLCGVCGVLLGKCASFRARCRRAQECLQKQDERQRTMDYIETIDRLSHNLVFTLALTQIKANEVGVPSEVPEVKEELSIVVKETIFKEEHVESFDLGIEDSPIDAETVVDDDDDDDERSEVSEIGKRIKIEKVLIPTDKVEVKERQSRKKKMERKNKKDELKKRRICGPSPTDEFQPNFDVAELEKELNVDIIILNKEQQLADWRQFSARKKTPAAFTCQECGKGFDFPESYNNHLLRHSPSTGAYLCGVCGVRFARRSERRTHGARHALRLTCRACRFVTRDKNQAKLHFNSHAGHKFQCKHCEKAFIKRSSCLSHMRLAHAPQNVSCGDCGETFVSRFGLTQHHTKVHKAQKAASKCACASCGAAFDNAQALHAHTRAADGCGDAVRPCAACGAALPSEEALQRHTEDCHKDQFKCCECGLLFTGALPLETHRRRVHSLQRRPPPRARPPRAPRPRSRVCAHCGKQCRNSFILEEHMRIHSGEKPYACPECALRFNCRANMRRHHKVVHLGQRRMVKCGECGKRLGAASLATHVKYVHRKLPQKPRQRNKNHKDQ